MVSAQVLNEFWVTVTAKLARPLPPGDAARVVADLGASIEVVPIDAGLVLAGIDRHLTDDPSLWDALVVEAARVSGCTTLLTEDLNHHGPGPRNAEGHNLGPCTGSAEGSALVVNGG